MISTSTRRHSFAPAHWRIFSAIAIAIAVCNVPLASAKVLVTSQTLGVSAAIYEFDDLGNLLGTLDVIPGGNVLFSIATDGARIIAGRAFDGFRKYSLDGAFQGYLTGLPSTMEGATVEFDAHGNIYLLGACASRRLNPDGTPSMTFPTGTTYGIDADAAGNVYIARQALGNPSGVYKYSPQGASIGFIGGVIGDLAIDEAGQMLYVGSDSIMAYDISGPTPSFVRSFAGPPTLAGISFDPATGHLFGASLFGGYATEMTTTGDFVRKYSIPGTNPLDVVAIRVPEAATTTLLVIAVACGPLRRLRDRRN